MTPLSRSDRLANGAAAQPSEVHSMNWDAEIRARSERQAMDWALVLASQGIESALERSSATGSWSLRMHANEYARALQSIHQYRLENRRFAWRQPIPGSHWSFHWGVLAWMVMCGTAFQIQPSLERGLFDTISVRQGEWWRAFTSIWLHQDLGHLGLNLVFGGIFLGLAMGRYGAGIAAWTGLWAGALGNLLGIGLRTENYVGLGASGMVMGALGMLAAQAAPFWRAGRWGARLAFSTFSAGAALFFLLGTDPKSDVLAHAGGFVGGALGGALFAWLPERFRRTANQVTGVLAGGLLLGTWYLALTHSKLE